MPKFFEIKISKYRVVLEKVLVHNAIDKLQEVLDNRDCFRALILDPSKASLSNVLTVLYMICKFQNYMPKILT